MSREKKRATTAVGMVLTFVLGVVGVAALLIGGSTGAAYAATSVTINGQSHVINCENCYRASNYLVRYTTGTSTGTNQYGFEAAVVNGKVTQVANSVGNMAIPSGGYVLSGHGTSRTWLMNNAHVGDTVTLDGSTPTSPPTSPPTTTPPPSGTELLPDVGIRTLRQFSIVNTGGKKLLKFPGVTANVGKGPLEVVGHRSSSTSTDWVATQHVFTTTGSKVNYAAPNLTFYYAGDGHTHWHMKDFDSYELFDPSGRRVATGEKHGFCFEDNTSYRDWPSTGKNGSPRNPVYTHENVCGVGQPSTTDITHGLSVGWADTYPATLPDQAIDITGKADGNYTAKICADAAGNIRESNESNNCATALIKITGNTVTLLSANDGL